jgi:hypothetical protein
MGGRNAPHFFMSKEYQRVPDMEEDLVNNPKHYNQGGIECIDAIRAMLSSEEFIGYLRGNSLKYRWRFRYKNGVQDLDKAEWYENRLKEELKKLDT